MSIKSWFRSLVEKMEKRSDEKHIQSFKRLNIRSIMLDEDVKLYFVTDKGITERDWISAELRKPGMEGHKKSFFDAVVDDYDELFGAHRQCTEDGKLLLVWDVK